MRCARKPHIFHVFWMGWAYEPVTNGKPRLNIHARPVVQKRCFDLERSRWKTLRYKLADMMTCILNWSQTSLLLYPTLSVLPQRSLTRLCFLLSRAEFINPISPDHQHLWSAQAGSKYQWFNHSQKRPRMPPRA